MRYFSAFIELLLYSNLWIAGAAVAMAAQSQLLLSGRIFATPLLSFIFFGTLFLYAVHRLVGLSKPAPFPAEGRYQVIFRFRKNFWVFAFLSGLGAAGSFFLMPLGVKVAAIIPCLVAIAYILPFLRGRRRLRDLSYLKIFMIALAWPWITVVLPAVELGMAHSLPMVLMAAERAAFIFAIALLFDIRDLKIDHYHSVKTLPESLGINRTRLVGGLALCLMMAIAWVNYRIDVYSTGVMAGLLVSAIFTFALIRYAHPGRHDYYYSGLADGMMPLQFLLILLLESWS